MLHRQFAKVHKLQEGYEALRKERDFAEELGEAAREKLSKLGDERLSLLDANTQLRAWVKKLEAKAAALSEEGENDG